MVLPGYLSRLFLVMVGILLAGYAFFGKTFAYLGVGPIYVGEITLSLGLLAACFHRRWDHVFRSPVIWALAAFVLWESICAVPYLSRYGLDTLRDSALWGYGAFAFLVALFLPHSTWFDTFPERYARWIPAFLLWTPIALLFSHAFSQFVAVSPVTGLPMQIIKEGDSGTHLGGVAAFLLLGLDRSSSGSGQGAVRRPRRRLAIRAAWLLAFACVAALGRGGALAALVAVLVVCALRPIEVVGRIPLIAGVGGTLVLVLLALNLTVELGRRDLSVNQIAANLGTVVGIEPPESMRHLEHTRDWRLRWWTKIVDYTVHGSYFWTGKGYGVNLAVDDGITINKSNRSPHNAHLNFLARSGVPGLLLWALVQATFGLVMIRAYFHARRLNRERWARVNLWILAYWVAFLMNASVDVFLEGPTGGIWFWTVLGVGIAVAEAQRHAATQGRVARLPGRLHEAAAAS
jgi:hypothetical protein